MKIYLDDERETPEGWRRTLTAFGTIALLDIGLLRNDEEVEEISLDHDLGEHYSTGYDVLLWIEQQVALNGFVPPKITIHSANSSARVKMDLAVRAIQELHNKNTSKRKAHS